jgi:hypothetical protein
MNSDLVQFWYLWRRYPISALVLKFLPRGLRKVTHSDQSFVCDMDNTQRDRLWGIKSVKVLEGTTA